MAALTIGFFTAFLVSARGRVADETFRVRWYSQERGFGVVLVAEFAIDFLPGIRKIVSDVQFVLFRIEEGVEIIALGEVALRRTSR